MIAVNTLLVDDNPTKNILNPLGTIIFPDTWAGDKNDTFLVNELTPYLGRLVHHPTSILGFVLSKPISNGPLTPTSDVYKAMDLCSYSCPFKVRFLSPTTFSCSHLPPAPHLTA